RDRSGPALTNTMRKVLRSSIPGRSAVQSYLALVQDIRTCPPRSPSQVPHGVARPVVAPKLQLAGFNELSTLFTTEDKNDLPQSGCLSWLRVLSCARTKRDRA